MNTIAAAAASVFMRYLRWIYNGTPSQTLPEGYYPSGPPAAKSVSPFWG